MKGLVVPSPRRMFFWLLALLSIAFLASCGSASSPLAESDSEEAAEAATPDDTTVTATDAPEPKEAGDGSFSSTIVPIVEATCARCHTERGPGTVHLAVDTAADVQANALDIAAVVGAGVMPPWPASEHSVEMKDNWSLTQDEIDAVVAWHADGAEIDVAPDTQIVASQPVIGLADYDEEVFALGAYDGEKGQPDEYRCFIYDPAVEGDTFITGYEFVPDQTEVVHHLIGYLADASLMDAALARNGEDGQDGWSCFGGSGIGAGEIFLGWAPGQNPVIAPEGTGLHLGDGDFMVLQIHYHYEVEAPADLSTIRLTYDNDPSTTELQLSQFLAPAEIPCLSTESGPLCNRDNAMIDAIAKYGPEGVRNTFINAACGATPEDFAAMTDGIITSSCDLPARVDGTIYSVLGHMHEIGASFRMTMNPDTPEEVVLLDIPNWDFEWQFNFEPAVEIDVTWSDTIRIECTWDRARRDADLEPAYILWADGTDDEMCFAMLTTY